MALSFPGGFQNPPANAGDLGLIPGLGSSPEEGNGNQVQCPCLGSPMEMAVAKESDTT